MILSFSAAVFVFHLAATQHAVRMKRLQSCKFCRHGDKSLKLGITTVNNPLKKRSHEVSLSVC